MIYKLLPIALFILLFAGCKKDTTVIQNPPNSILHTELQPFLEVTSVDSLILHPSGCGYIPSPSDTTSSIELDINDDGQIDFTLTCASWYEFVSASGPCANYNTSIVISGTSDDRQIALNQNFNAVKLLAFGDTIDGSGEWSRNATLLLYSALAPFSTDFNGDYYLGLTVTQGQNQHFGWISINKSDYLITVKSFALNTTSNSSITAGQIQ